MYFFTVGNDPDSSIERLLAHLAPVALYVTALVANDNSNHLSLTLTKQRNDNDVPSVLSF